MSRTRSVSVCVIIAGLLCAARAARAESGMLPNGASITFNRLFITQDGNDQEPSTPDDLRRYLNLSHCVCAQAMAGDMQSVRYETKTTIATGTHRPGELWVGTQCDDDTVRNMMCRQVGSIADIDTLAVRPENIEWNLYDVINGKDNTAACQQRAGDAFAWILVDSNGDNTYDYFQNQSVGKTATVTGIDTEPPPLPSDFVGEGAEGGIRISWTVPDARATDIFYYQALCVGPDGAPAKSDPPDARYQTVGDVCGLAQSPDLVESDIDSTDDTTVTLPDELKDLDSAFICGESDTATANNLLITGLKNDTPYRVVLLAIDNYGNFAGTFFNKTITPHPATDFWEDLHDRGSDVEGGFCLLAETYGDDNPITNLLRDFRDDTLGGSGFGRALTRAYYGSLAKLGAYVHGSLALRIVAGVLLAPLVVLALAWHFLTLPGLLALLALAVWLRRRRKLGRVALRLAPAVAAGAILLAPALSRAGGPSPYWTPDHENDDEEAAAADTGVPLVTWHAGLRIGPYVPDIDKQFGMSPGPYHDMFGGARYTPMLDVDRIIWRGFGQVAVGGSIGYMQKTAHAWADGTTPGDPNRMRSPGDTNTFRLLPLSANVTYRFTWLDDEYGIPVVPYAKVGLAYYLWWIRSNGDTAAACWDGTHTQGCDADKGIGASPGFVGSIGLAIRAERIDGNAATSMQQSGIMHAGFYGELSLAKVDGFGSDTKLSVGDRTWFAGVDFEF